MPKPDNELPKRTDKVVPGAMKTSDTTTAVDPMHDPVPVTEVDVIEPEPTAKDKVVAKVREGRDKVATEAAGQARGLLGQGLERGSQAVGNVAKLVNDSAPGIDDNLGTEYGDYARKAATYLDETAQSLAAKDPDEIIEDTRDFVRKSPGIALAGAAIIGFALARLIQSGIDAETDRN